MPDASLGPKLALTAPATPLTRISQTLLQQAVAASRVSPRKRIIFPFHKGDPAPLHRMFNAVQPGTYIRPHRHLNPPKAESIIVLQGALHFFVFEASGEVQEHFPLQAGTLDFGVDIEPGVIHTFIARAPDTVVFEVKTGPYNPANDKDFSSWAPKETDPAMPAYLEQLTRLAEGK
jgi:cupin fold WbuC family metalloprotein